MRQTTTSFDYEPREREFTPQSKRAVPAPGPQPYGAITSQSIPLNSPLTTVFKRELPDTSETKPHEKKHKSARAQKDHEKLAAVNGVVIPSKLDPGTKPTPQQSHADDQSYLSHTCTICKSRFGKTSHVKSHFPACVERFGNPNGARWDDDIRFQRRKRAPLKRTVRDDGESAPEHEGTLLQRPFTVEEREQGIRQRELAVSEREQAVSKREMAVLKREEAVSRDEQLINGWAKPVQEHDDTLYRQYRSGPSFPERGLSQQVRASMTSLSPNRRLIRCSILRHEGRDSATLHGLTAILP